MTSISHILEFLPCATPNEWLEFAVQTDNLSIILIDHANNELKAAQSALTIIGRYRSDKFGLINGSKSKRGESLNCEDRFSLLNKMSRLAREELRHYEQVLSIMARRSIPYTYLASGRYAGLLGSLLRTYEPARLVDTLIMGAFIEARSCERFAALAPHLDDELGLFYRSLLKSESRHYQDYLKLAELFNGEPVDDRVAAFAMAEKNAITSPDENFRFHSGIPI